MLSELDSKSDPIGGPYLNADRLNYLRIGNELTLLRKCAVPHIHLFIFPSLTALL